jgi:hypothetical protein
MIGRSGGHSSIGTAGHPGPAISTADTAHFKRHAAMQALSVDANLWLMFSAAWLRGRQELGLGLDSGEPGFGT